VVVKGEERGSISPSGSCRVCGDIGKTGKRGSQAAEERRGGGVLE
jgi:hypothetical protein